MQKTYSATLRLVLVAYAAAVWAAAPLALAQGWGIDTAAAANQQTASQHVISNPVQHQGVEKQYYERQVQQQQQGPLTMQQQQQLLQAVKGQVPTKQPQQQQQQRSKGFARVGQAISGGQLFSKSSSLTKAMAGSARKRAAAAAASSIAGGATVTELRPGCKKMLWFTSVPGGNQSQVVWSQLVAAALSARDNAPNLQPVLVYLSPPDHYSRWMEKQGGGILLYHNLTFADKLEQVAWAAGGLADGHWQQQASALSGIDVPMLVMRLRPLLDEAKYDLERVLFGPPDVLFLKDLHSCVVDPVSTVSVSSPSTGSAAGGGGGGSTPLGTDGASQVGSALSESTGTPMMLNVATLFADADRLVAFAQERLWHFSGFQDLARQFYAGHLEQLPRSLAWDPSSGSSDAAMILTFPGLTPGDRCLSCFVRTRNQDKEAASSASGCGCTGMAAQLLAQAVGTDDARLYEEAYFAYHRYVEESGLMQPEADTSSISAVSGQVEAAQTEASGQAA